MIADMYSGPSMSHMPQQSWGVAPGLDPLEIRAVDGAPQAGFMPYPQAGAMGHGMPYDKVTSTPSKPSAWLERSDSDKALQPQNSWVVRAEYTPSKLGHWQAAHPLDQPGTPVAAAHVAPSSPAQPPLSPALSWQAASGPSNALSAAGPLVPIEKGSSLSRGKISVAARLGLAAASPLGAGGSGHHLSGAPY
jgi:hypothetical protein